MSKIGFLILKGLFYQKNSIFALIYPSLCKRRMILLDKDPEADRQKT